MLQPSKLKSTFANRLVDTKQMGGGGVLLSFAGRISPEKARELGIRAELSNTLLSAEAMQEIAQVMAGGHVKAIISHFYPLHAAREAHIRSQTGHGRGRIVLEI